MVKACRALAKVLTKSSPSLGRNENDVVGLQGFDYLVDSLNRYYHVLFRMLDGVSFLRWPLERIHKGYLPKYAIVCWQSSLDQC